MSWPPIPPESFDLVTTYGLHFSPGAQDEEGVNGVCACLESYQDCANAIVQNGEPLSLEQMRDYWRNLPHGTTEIADLGFRALGYHGWGCARYGKPTSPKSGAGYGHAGIEENTDPYNASLDGSGGSISFHGSGDPYSHNFEGHGKGGRL